MKSVLRVFLFLSLSVVFLAGSGCGYNRIQQQDEAVKAAWAEVLNQYKRRSDLIPNLVETVKGYAGHEKEVFVKVAEARASAGSIQATPELINDPQAFSRFVSAQSQMGSALSRLLVVAENYPELKANESFRDLSAEIAGAENRITVARKRYIEAVEQYNVLIRSIPVNFTALIFGYKIRPTFQVEDEREISKPPEVKF